MKIESIIFILAIVIFITFYVLAIFLKDKPISDYIITGGIGAIFAGTFFGIMKNSIMNQNNNNNIFFNLYIIIFFFLWYNLTKIIANAIKNKEVDRPIAIQLPATYNTNIDIIEKEKLKNVYDWKDGLSKALISFIIIFIIVMLGISFYRGGDDNNHFFIFNILITVIISLAVLFSFFSGNRLTYKYKIEILSYTFSYGIVFSIIAPLFLFQSFSMRNSITMTLIFFIWISITFSISNFLNMKKEYIKRV
jgi:hypothetical protein